MKRPVKRRRSLLPGRVPPGKLFVGTMGLVAAAVLAILLFGGWMLWQVAGPGPKAAQGETTVVMLEPGAGLRKIASVLEEADAIRSETAFAIAAQLSGAARELKAGEYEFPSRMPMAKVLGKIRRGEVVRRFVTIPEGMTSEMAAGVLAANPYLTGVALVPPEGALLPETYEIRRGEDRSAVLKRMTDARDKALADLWAKRQPDLPINTPEEAVVLASIVEKETGKAEERPRVAAVYINRLRIGMPLQSDPTVIYGVSRGRPLGRGILRSELDTLTPYNTYMVAGLPPTPIANPGKESLAAVLNPPKTEEIYFVADGTGGHVFATTLEEHARNVVRWRQIEQERAAQAQQKAR